MRAPHLWVSTAQPQPQSQPQPQRLLPWHICPVLLGSGTCLTGSRTADDCSEPLSINAGCACYFLGQEMLNQVECTDETKLRMYQIWIEALRGGHAGQGLDIHGSDHLMDAAVESGDSKPVEASVHCIHRLKTAFPARCLAQMGAIYGGGSDEEVDAIGVFFEATGLAFQIIDDVLNLRGLVKPGEKMSQALKVVGEDITEGKVTAPIAKAMSLLKTKKERQVRTRCVIFIMRKQQHTSGHWLSG